MPIFQNLNEYFKNRVCGRINKYLIKNYPLRWAAWRIDDMIVSLETPDSDAKEFNATTRDGHAGINLSFYDQTETSRVLTGLTLHNKKFSWQISMPYAHMHQFFKIVNSKHEQQKQNLNNLQQQVNNCNADTLSLCKMFLECNPDVKVKMTYPDLTKEDMSFPVSASFEAKQGELTIDQKSDPETRDTVYSGKAVILNRHMDLENDEPLQIWKMLRRHNFRAKISNLKNRIKSVL